MNSNETKQALFSDTIVYIYTKAAPPLSTTSSFLVAFDRSQTFREFLHLSRKITLKNTHANDLLAKACQNSVRNKQPTEMPFETCCSR